MSPDLREREREALAGDGHLQRAIRRSTDNMDGRWGALRAELEDADALREAARSLRSAAIARLPELLGQLADNVEAAGGTVFFAADADEATGYIIRLAHRRKAKLAVKSKSMVTEEIKLNTALAAAGVEAVETDLGEWAQQLDGEPPAHILGPALHKSKDDWVRVLGPEGYSGGEDPDAMTAFARRTLRPRFLSADLGITGVNLGVAETGTLLTVTNEGNGRLTAGAPPVHVAVMGMERVVASWAEADLLLALLARAGAGVPFATYVNCVTGPRRAHELDGPDELHLVIVDNGRSNILGSPSQEALNCIRCGACLNACPVYRQIGGHAYGDVYSGPIGAVIVPLLAGHARGPRALARLLAVRRVLEGVPGRDPAARAAARRPRVACRLRARAVACLGARVVEPARLRALRRARRPAPAAGPDPAAVSRLGQGARAAQARGRDVPRPLEARRGAVNREAFLARLDARLAAAAPPATAHPPKPPPANGPAPGVPARRALARGALRRRAARHPRAAGDGRGAACAVRGARDPDRGGHHRPAGAARGRAAPARAGPRRRRRRDRGRRRLRGHRHGRARPVGERDADGQPAAARARRRRAARRAGRDARRRPARPPSAGSRDGLPSAFALASGPSKSADIDAEVTYGVHGPLAVIAVMIEEDLRSDPPSDRGSGR